MLSVTEDHTVLDNQMTVNNELVTMCKWSQPSLKYYPGTGTGAKLRIIMKRNSFMMVSDLNWASDECKSLTLVPELSCHLHNTRTLLKSTK